MNLDLRVHEVEADGSTVFYIVNRGTENPVLNPVATLIAYDNVDETREIAHLFANAPDMQRAGMYSLPHKRFADEALFANLRFREVSEETFKSRLGGAPLAKASQDLEDAISSLELPDRVEEDFPATYTHDAHTKQGFADEATAAVDEDPDV